MSVSQTILHIVNKKRKFPNDSQEGFTMAKTLMSEGLRAELAPLGIKVMIVEPGAFRTHFYDSSLKGSVNRISDYSSTAWLRSVAQNRNPGNQPGDPNKTGDVLIEAIESEEPPCVSCWAVMR